MKFTEAIDSMLRVGKIFLFLAFTLEVIPFQSVLHKVDGIKQEKSVNTHLPVVKKCVYKRN
jgi:hypothetical protein